MPQQPQRVISVQGRLRAGCEIILTSGYIYQVERRVTYKRDVRGEGVVADRDTLGEACCSARVRY